MAKARAKEVKTTYSADELRKALNDAPKEILVPIAQTLFHGKLNDVINRIESKAREGGIVGEIEIGKRGIRKKYGYKRYGGSNYYTEQTLCLIGLRPYTDAELLEEGPSLIMKERKRLERAHKSAVKKVNEFNRLAREVGQAEIPVPEMPTLPELP